MSYTNEKRYQALCFMMLTSSGIQDEVDRQLGSIANRDFHTQAEIDSLLDKTIDILAGMRIII